MYQRTYVNINLAAIRHNILEVKKHIKQNTKLLAVVKANAYGHGSIQVANALKDEVDYFAVATLEEAVVLREHGITKPILILSYTSYQEYETVIEYDITQTLYSSVDAKRLAQKALQMKKTANVHICVDTGMTRIGFAVNEKGIQEAKTVCQMEGIFVEGVFSHFSKADEKEDAYSKQQMERFDFFIKQVEGKGIQIPIHHLCNSAGLMKYEKQAYDMVRSGIITYGMYPSKDVNPNILSLEPALEWKAHVIHLANVPAGVKVSYEGTYTTQRASKIATISVGYADGYPRSLSNCGEVLIKGKRAKILGRIRMDQMMVDVTDIPDISMEEVVTLVGKDGNEVIDMESLGACSHRFHYELSCDIGNRVARCYV